MDLNSLYRFFTRRSSEAEVSSIRSWAESSTENMQSLIDHRRMFDALLLLTDDYRSNKRQQMQKFYRNISYAAIAIGVALVSVFATLHLRPEPSPDMLAIKVPPGQQLELSLADGTTVYVNGGSSLSYPTVFAKDQRVVGMEGQCFFDVSQNPNRPFIIQTSQGSVQVLGTTLDVDVNTEDAYFNTALLEGKANVESHGKIYSLSPGEMVTISGDDAVVSPIPEGDEHLWTQGIVSFHDQSFPNIMKRFEKYFGVKIQIINPENFDQSYSGKFYINDGVEYALKVLQYDTRFTYDWDHDTQIITIQ